MIRYTKSKVFRAEIRGRVSTLVIFRKTLSIRDSTKHFQLPSQQHRGVSSPIGSPGGAGVSNYDVNFCQQHTRIGTWNVRTMAQAGKIQTAIKEMERLNLKVLGVSEMRWPGASYCDIGDHRIYYSGVPSKYEHGVGIIIHKSVAQNVSNFVPVNERLMLVQVKANPANINILQVYAPTSDYSETEIDNFYAQVSKVVNNIPKKEIQIILGDFNAKIGKGRSGNYVGPHGLGDRNDNGEKLWGRYKLGS